MNFECISPFRKGKERERERQEVRKTVKGRKGKKIEHAVHAETEPVSLQVTGVRQGSGVRREQSVESPESGHEWCGNGSSSGTSTSSTMQ